MKVGFIGTGTMGTLLIESFIRSGALCPKQVVASNRSMDKVNRLAGLYPGLSPVNSNREVAEQSDIIFLCVRPLVFKTVIDEIKGTALPGQIIISITSPVLLRHLETALPSKIAKAIPSITNSMLSGSVLCIYGERMASEDIEMLDRLFAHIAKPVRIQETQTRAASDLSSCGPAFLAYFVQKLAEAATEVSGLPKEEATRLVSEMVLGTGKLLTEGEYTPESLLDHVVLPGGIIEAGLHLMERELDTVFLPLLRATYRKYNEDVEKIDSMFFGKIADCAAANQPD
jgi:competence protein ComER